MASASLSFGGSPQDTLFPFTAPVNGDYAWINQGGASVDTSYGWVFLSAPAATGTNLRIRKKALPSVPYTLTMGFLPLLPTAEATEFPHVGMLLRLASSGAVVSFGVQVNGDSSNQLELIASRWDNVTTFNSSQKTLLAEGKLCGPCGWLRIQDNNTNRIMQTSVDGRNFATFYSEARTNFITPDECGFFVNANNANHTVGLTVLSWAQA